MATFFAIREGDWINLDHVVRIYNSREGQQVIEARFRAVKPRLVV